MDDGYTGGTFVPVPLMGTLILAFSAGRLGPRASSVIGVGSVGLAALATLWAVMGHGGGTEGVTLWTWIAVGDFQPTIGLAVDGLALVMMSVITGVGFLIHLFAAWYMTGEAGITRFYAWMNLFVFSMMLLVLGTTCCCCSWAGKVSGCAVTG